MTDLDPPSLLTPAESAESAESAEIADSAEAAKAGLVTRTRKFVDDSRVRAVDTIARLEGQRSSRPVIDAIFGSVETDARTGGDLLAGAVAFRIFLLVVPYVLMIVLGFAVIGDITGTDPQVLVGRSGIGGVLASTVNVAQEVQSSTRLIGFLIVVYAVVSGAKKMVKALRAVHARIWQVPLAKVRRPYLAGLTLVGIIAAGSLLVGLIGRLRELSLVAGLVATALYILVPASLWLLVSVKWFPSAPGATWRDLWPGAVLFGGGVQGLHIVTVVWIAGSVESKSAAYGAIGGSLTILLWAYMMGRIVTAAVALNAAVWQRVHPPTLPES